MIAAGDFRVRGGDEDSPLPFRPALGLVLRVTAFVFSGTAAFLVVDPFDLADGFGCESLLMLASLLVRFGGGGMFSTSESVVAGLFPLGMVIK